MSSNRPRSSGLGGASEVIAELPSQGGKATVERIATNAVMAGRWPEYMPVILTALEGMLETRCNLRGVVFDPCVDTFAHLKWTYRASAARQ
jgi:hypothetical protein